MRIKLQCCCFVLLITSAASAQTDQEMSTLVHDLAARLRSPESTGVHITQYQMPEFAAEISTDTDVNAHADVIDGHKVVLNRSLVQAFYNAPGELAFIIAHEIGHLQNESACHQKWAKAQLDANALQRQCESEADQVGMQYLLAAGFSPYDAAGVMGRLLMAAPDHNSIRAVMFDRYSSDHPASMDRINQLRDAAIQACQDRPEICLR